MTTKAWLTKNHGRIIGMKILTERQLEIFQLREVDGLQFRLIGLRFGCTPEDVKRSYYRARRILATRQFDLSSEPKQATSI